MNVQIEKITAIYPAFSPAENGMMMEIDNQLGRFIKELGDPDDMVLVSQSTGEVISIDEIRRVRGVLDALYNTCVWRVEE
jgi:hypothetical protein